jgi:hypothetical protein
MKTKRLGARWLVVGLALSSIAVACGRSSGSASPDESGGAECETNRDCGGPFSCIEGKCIQSSQLGDGGTGDLPGQAGAASLGGGSGYPGHILEGGSPDGGGPPSTGGGADGGAPAVDPCSSCSLTQTCIAGECQDILCTPGSTSCVEGNVWKCNATGTAQALSSDCKDDEFCAEQGGGAICSPTQCVPGAVMCDGQVATRCRSDGSAPQAGGKDCAASSEVCYDGQCLTQGCTPGQKLCQHDDVYLCTASGTSTVVFENCADDEACDPDLGQCRKRLCTPGLLGCDSNRVARCNALGVGWEQTGTDCATANAICVEGSCKPLVCTPSTSFCEDSGVYGCDALGIKKTLQQQCGDAYYCTMGYSYAYCAYDVCTANAKACNGNSVTSCAADGSGLLPGGTPCANGEGCSGGACKKMVCDPGKPFCQGNTPAYCDNNGVDSTTYGSCPDDTSCKLISAYEVTCAPHNCQQGEQTCLANQVGKCDDGFVLTSVSSDCAATQQVCSADLQCADTAVDALGGATDLKSFATGEVAGDAIKVLSNRTLTQIEANLVLASSRTLTWVVLEQINNSYFSEIFAKDVAGQSGSGYFSSGKLSLQLKAGKTYGIGVRTATGSIAAYRTAAALPAFASLGKVLGGVAGYYIDTSVLNDERITTAP